MFCDLSSPVTTVALYTEQSFEGIGPTGSMTQRNQWAMWVYSCHQQDGLVDSMTFQ